MQVKLFLRRLWEPLHGTEAPLSEHIAAAKMAQTLWLLVTSVAVFFILKYCF